MPLRVLFIDDDVLVLDTFLSLARFTYPSWTLQSASEHDTGFVIAGEFMPHVICADIGSMPKPGLVFAEHIRKDERLKNTFLIATTGWDDARTLGEIHRAGFDVCLTKPIGFRLLSQHIQAFAEMQMLLR